MVAYLETPVHRWPSYSPDFEVPIVFSQEDAFLS